MDILNPELVWIDNRCYRKLPIKESEGKNYEEKKPVSFSSREYKEEEDYSDVPIRHEGNRFFTTILTPPLLLGAVRGYRNALLDDLKGRTFTEIKIMGKSGEISIFGQNVNCVGDAYRRILDIISRARFKKDSTHFISFPINEREIQKGFLKFKEAVLSECKGVRGISDSIFQTETKLHITVTPIVLLDPRDRENATAVLQNCKNRILNILDTKELVVQVKGIEYMNDDPSEVDVLYAKVQEVDNDTCLQIIANTLYEAFVEAGYSKKQYDSVKLHITIMNSLFRDNKNQERETFDAQPLLEKYGDFEFGQTTISEIHISIRYTTRKDGYYTPSSILKLN